ncbi:hypothetical protein LZ32DRAFT_610249 [Colletotrichum eremochloae]|nr:hypothetical protein LZ32DRAFT_610249 [Colletotrichum eremochloae]
MSFFPLPVAARVKQIPAYVPSFHPSQPCSNGVGHIPWENAEAAATMKLLVAGQAS